jgi:4-hydroxybenzoate polyprenyltransferase
MYSFGWWGLSRVDRWRGTGWSRWCFVEFIEILKKKIFLLKELFFFTRPETCLFMSGIAISGCLFFNVLDVGVVFLFLAVFFTSGTAYSINYLTDKEEDVANNEKINVFVTNGKGVFAVVLFILVSFISSLFLSKLSLIFYLVCLCWGLFYSLFKIKKIFLLKHFYIAMTFVITFLIGTTYGNELTVEMFTYLPFIFLFGFLLNLLGDLRGHEGDKSIGMKTIPIVFGHKTAKRVIYLVVGLFSGLVVYLNFIELFPLLFFVLLFSFFLSRNDLKSARLCLLSSFVFLPFILALFGGVII